MRPETENLIVGEPEPVLRVLPDQELTAMWDVLRRAAGELKRDGLEDAAWCLLAGLGGKVRAEQEMRAEALEVMRVDLVANGHEGSVRFDEFLFESAPREGWYACCTCDWYSEHRTETEARAAGGEHLAGHGGAWAEDSRGG